MKSLKVSVFTLLLIVAISTLTNAQQNTPSITLNNNERVIFEAMNQERYRTNAYIPLVLNEDLNRIAKDQLDYISRNEGVEYYKRSDGTVLEDWLQAVEYPQYPRSYANQSSDIQVYVSQEIIPQDFVKAWVNDQNFDLSYRQVAIPPFYSRFFREVGIAFVFDSTLRRYYYVVVLASRPNYFPIVVVNFDKPYLPLQRVETQQILLLTTKEDADPDGDVDYIGAFELMRISNDPLPPLQVLDNGTTCPDDRSQFVQFDADYTHTLTSGIGEKTIYLQYCDRFGGGYDTQLTVTYNPSPVDNVPTLILDTLTPTTSPTLTSATETTSSSSTAIISEQVTPLPSPTDIPIIPSDTSTTTPTPVPVTTTATQGTLSGERYVLKWNNQFLVVENGIDRLPQPLVFTDNRGDSFAYTTQELQGYTGNCVVVYDATQYDLTQEKAGPTIEEIRDVAVCQSDNIALIPIYQTPFWSIGTDAPFKVSLGIDTYVCRTDAQLRCVVGTDGVKDNVITDESTLVKVRLLWNDQLLGIINNSDVGIDLADFRLVGFAEETFWNIDEGYDIRNVRPGSCLLIFVGDERPDETTIAGLNCSRVIGDMQLTTYTQDVWVETRFSTNFGDECEGTASGKIRCDVSVPQSER
jgi:uncharacterized protein YkwD